MVQNLCLGIFFSAMILVSCLCVLNHGVSSSWTSQSHPTFPHPLSCASVIGFNRSRCGPAVQWIRHMKGIGIGGGQIEAIAPILGETGGTIVYAITRLAFVSAVMTLFPLTVGHPPLVQGDTQDEPKWSILITIKRDSILPGSRQW
jgi:hypothetical protein